MIDFFDKKIFQPNAIVFFVAAPKSDVYKYQIFKGVIQKLIDKGESYYYQIKITHILSKKDNIKLLNHSVWWCSKITNEQPYRCNKKFASIKMDSKKFLSMFDVWDMNVAPVFVYETKKEAQQKYNMVNEYLIRKLEADLEYLHKQDR